MLVLVTGGAASGKSEHAAKIICAGFSYQQFEKFDSSEEILATMQPFGKSARARIARHRKLRDGKGFHTVERSLDLKGLQIDRHYDGILLEDLGNLLANEIFSPDGTAQNCVKSILDGVEKLKSYCDTLVIVSNEIFSDGGSYPPETENYLQKLAELHEKITRDADAVYESVCGILLPIKEVKTR